jgi:hypothetical protein
MQEYLSCAPASSGMKRILLALVLFPLLIQAQPFLDIANVHFQYSAADKTSDKHTLYTELTSVSFTLPLKIDSDYFVINPVYENFRLIFPAVYDNKEFHAGYIPLSWLNRWNAKWKTAFVFIPRVSSEFENGFSSRDMQYGGAVLNIIQKKETLKFKFGLYYHGEFFGPFFMPLLGLDWNINSKWNLYGVLPGSMNIEYKLNKIVHAGILFRSITSSYRTYDFHFIRVNDNHLKLFLDLYLTKHHIFSLEAGHTILRKYKSGYRASGAPDYDPMDVSNGYLFRISYSYRVRTDESN